MRRRAAEIESAAEAEIRLHPGPADLQGPVESKRARLTNVAGEWASFDQAAVSRVLGEAEPADISDLCGALESASAIIQRVVSLLDEDLVTTVSDVESLSCGALVSDDAASLLLRLAEIVEQRPWIFARPEMRTIRPWAQQYDPALMTGLRRATPAEAQNFSARISRSLADHADELRKAGTNGYGFHFGMFNHPDAPLRHQMALYRWFDADDRLLYIGITGDLGVRTAAHTKGSSWMDFAASRSVQHYWDRFTVERAEVKAIKQERPLFNRQHNDTPEARQRLVEYLIEKGRTDLLRPAVSRG
jgi:predicted GIY-YIG superfamily endonuclease